MNYCWGAYETLVNFIEMWLLYSFLGSFFTRKLKGNIKLFACISILAIIIHVSNNFFGVASLIGFLISMVFMIPIFCLIFSGSIWTLILGIIVFSTLLGVFDFISAFTITAVYNIKPIQIAEPTAYRVICTLFSKAICYLCVRFINKYKLSGKNIKKMYVYELIIVLVINIAFMFIVFSVYTNNAKIGRLDERYIAVFTLGIVVISILIIKIVEQIAKYSQKETEWNLKEIEYGRQIDYMRNMDLFMHKIKAQRHDFNNHIGCVYGLLIEGKLDAAKVYINKLIEEVQDINSIIKVENPTIAALLNFKFSIALEKKIKFNIDVRIPKELNINPIDISIILGNAIDNSIEACEKLDNRFIELIIYIEKEYLIIKITNTKKDDCLITHDEYKTTKADKENHGLGIKNIKYVVEKYDGLLKISEEEELFTMNIAIKNDSY
jgi:hypothetical protein